MSRFALRALTLALASLAVVHASSAFADARPRDPMNAAQMRQALQKLRVVGSALYVAAHPDDENTALLAYLTSGRKVRTAYLSMTRGDGGQNLIGTETGELLGVIRTQELLAARRLDGAEQFFTRAVDFGFSKNAQETMAFWGHDAILSDVVQIIRTFRPDVIITRFPPDSTAGHGHHTASAMLAEEAFAAAADPTRFPEQLTAGLKPWQATRLVWNVFQRQGAPVDTGMRVDLGSWNPLLGRAYTEIAGESRSMHKSQGFGAPERRGSIPNGFRLRAGRPAKADLFEGVTLAWSRFPGGAKVDAALAEAEKKFDPERPEAIVPILLRARTALNAMTGDDPLLAKKRAELDELVRSCAGLWMEAIAAAPAAAPGAALRVTTSVLNRSSLPLVLERVELPATVRVAPPAGASPGAADSAAELRDAALPFNRPVAGLATLPVPEPAAGAYQPFWLAAKASPGAFAIADPKSITLAENAPALSAVFHVRVAGQSIPFRAPLLYRWTDPVAGERYRTFQIVPPVTLRLDQGVYVFPAAAARAVRVVARSAGAPVTGTVRLALPEGWRAEPASQPLSVAGDGAETTLEFTVTPGEGAASGVLGASVEADGRTWSHRLVTIDYPHIPVQTLFPPAEAKLVRADIKRVGENVGYVMGSGDQIPEALRQMGYKVTLLEDADVESGALSRFDAIIVGVRAYNTRPRLRALQPKLLDWVKAGGTLVVQYNTADPGLDDRLGPWPFKISRDRVTVEDAPVRMMDPNHPLLARPNRIQVQDFLGWVQERGLYFANPWDPKYQTVLSSNDPGEPARDGGLLYARHGQGVFIYTGYAWFRELPAGVPGAYRLFMNMVDARNDTGRP